MDCAQTRTYIESYADRELDPVTSIAVEKHLANCAACARALTRLTALSSLIRDAAPYHAVPPRLSERVRKRVGTKTPESARDKPPLWWRWLQPALLVASTAIVTWIVATQMNTGVQRDVLAEAVITSHARSIVTSHLTDVASSDRHTVKPWLSAKLDYSPPVTDLAAVGFPLVGGRLDYFNNRPVAALVYKRREHVINLFVWPENDGRALAPGETTSRQGYQMLHWSQNGMMLWAISDLNAKELKAFAESFASAS